MLRAVFLSTCNPNHPVMKAALGRACLALLDAGLERHLDGNGHCAHDVQLAVIALRELDRWSGGWNRRAECEAGGPWPTHR